MVRFLRSTALAGALSVSAAVNASPQAPPLVFTLAAPEERLAADVQIHASAAVAERGLALWSGSSSDFGIGIDVNGGRWMVHSTANITLLLVGREPRPTFQQLEIARTLFSTATASVAGGGGVRQESDGTRAVIGRALMTAQVAGGRLQGSFVMERVVSSPMRRDAADVITSVGWSRPIRPWLTLGFEGIAQDIEGFWDHAEADGGARLLVGPSLHVQSRKRDWSATASVGPVLHTVSTALPYGGVRATQSSNGRHFGIFASASWIPSRD